MVEIKYTYYTSLSKLSFQALNLSRRFEKTSSVYDSRRPRRVRCL